jgi:hypothetical protein
MKRTRTISGTKGETSVPRTSLHVTSEGKKRKMKTRGKILEVDDGGGGFVCVWTTNQRKWDRQSS